MKARPPDLTAHDLIRSIAGRPADLYVAETLIPSLARVMRIQPPSLEGIRTALQSPYSAFALVLGHYCVARRGQEKEWLSRMMCLALTRTLGESSFSEFLESGDSEALWLSFVEVCAEEGKKCAEQQNRPVIEGIAQLAFEIYEELGHGNIVEWICDEIVETHRCESLFNRLVEIRSLGPKSASQILRDVVFIYDVEDTLDYCDRLFLQPINAVVRRVANYVLDPPGNVQYADWVLAGKLSKAVRLANSSGVRFSFGCGYIGRRLSAKLDRIDLALRELVESS